MKNFSVKKKEEIAEGKSDRQTDRQRGAYNII
jgi:hypothetical protein